MMLVSSSVCSKTCPYSSSALRFDECHRHWFNSGVRTSIGKKKKKKWKTLLLHQMDRGKRTWLLLIKHDELLVNSAHTALEHVLSLHYETLRNQLKSLSLRSRSIICFIFTSLFFYFFSANFHKPSWLLCTDMTREHVFPHDSSRGSASLCFCWVMWTGLSALICGCRISGLHKHAASCVSPCSQASWHNG